MVSRHLIHRLSINMKGFSSHQCFLFTVTLLLPVILPITCKVHATCKGNGAYAITYVCVVTYIVDTRTCFTRIITLSEQNSENRVPIIQKTSV